jgi:hypothetical protein
MKHLLIGLFVLICSRASAQSQQFEGVISFDVTDLARKSTSKASASVTANNLYLATQTIDSLGQNNYDLWLKPEQNALYLLGPDRKNVIKMGYEVFQNPASQQGVLSSTGETRTFAGGFVATKHTMQSGTNRIELWLSEGLSLSPVVMRVLAQANPAYAAMFKAGYNQLPFLAEVYGLQDNRLQLRQEIVRLQPQVLDAKTFELPTGLTVLNTQQFQQLMQKELEQSVKKGSVQPAKPANKK